MTLRFSPLLLLLVSGPSAAGGQRPATIEWNVPGMRIVASDKTALVKLARKVGLELEHVGVETIRPGAGRLITMRSVVRVEGRHRSWLEIPACREDWQYCNYEASEQTHVGRWLARKQQLTRCETWEVQDGTWTSDIPIAPGISVTDTERIVLAIRRKQLVNRLPSSSSAAMPLDGKFYDVTWIHRTAADTAAYEVWTGVAGGQMLRVKIVGDTVELIDLSIYIV